MSSRKKVVLVTGANSGIGFAIAKVVASSSPDYHVLVGARSDDKGNKAVEELKSLIPSGKGTVSYLNIDVTDPKSIEKAADEVQREYTSLHGLINNAGVAGNDLTQENMSRIFGTNMIGPVLVSDAFNHLLTRDGGYSIFVSSSLGSLAIARDEDHPYSKEKWIVYRMSKAGLNMFAIEQYKELKPKGVKVFTMCPGLVRSNLRGTKEEQVNAGGNAGDPDVSGQTIVDMLDGKRDAEAGKFLHKDGDYPW